MTATTVRPTKKQQLLLVYIEQFIAEHGYSPSYREIMNGCQYNSVATVALHVGNLIKRGHLRKRDHSARSIEVVKNPDLDDTAQVADSKRSAEREISWLVSQAERLMQDAEHSLTLTSSQIGDIGTILRACSILGSDGETEELYARYKTLSQKSSILKA